MYHISDDHACNIGQVSLKLIVVGVYPFLNCVVETLYLQHMLALGYNVDTYLQQGQLDTGLLKISIHPCLINTESSFSVICHDLLDHCDHWFDVMIFGHKSHDEIDVVDDGDEEWDTVDKYEVFRQGD